MSEVGFVGMYSERRILHVECKKLVKLGVDRHDSKSIIQYNSMFPNRDSFRNTFTDLTN